MSLSSRQKDKSFAAWSRCGKAFCIWKAWSNADSQNLIFYAAPNKEAVVFAGSVWCAFVTEPLWNEDGADYWKSMKKYLYGWDEDSIMLQVSGVWIVWFAVK